MLFNSFDFFLFFLFFVSTYYFVPYKFRWAYLLIASIIFYMAFKPIYILILFLIIGIDYTCALFIEKTRSTTIKRFLLAGSLISNISILAYYKYFHFILEQFSIDSHRLGFIGNPSYLGIILPLGLSFHTFQSMAYTIEVAKGNQKAEKHLGYFAGYVLFFPQMVAGPIERYATLGNQLRKNIPFEYTNISNGLRLILFGLFIKVVVADSFSSYPDLLFEHPELYGSLDSWLGVGCFSIQIYADFFGYSTIALGTAKMLGIDLMDNFKNPYLTENIVEFWKRWHISLTNWFREYVYFSIGGNRVSTIRWILNILLVFALSGLWHGANWTFVCWGILHGILFLAETPLSKIKPNHRLLSIGLMLLNFVLISLIWIFFRAANFKTAWTIIKTLTFEFKTTNEQFQFPFKIILILLLFLLSEIYLKDKRFDACMTTLSAPKRWSVYGVLLLCILLFSELKTKPFIYFQF